MAKEFGKDEIRGVGSKPGLMLVCISAQLRKTQRFFELCRCRGLVGAGEWAEYWATGKPSG